MDDGNTDLYYDGDSTADTGTEEYIPGTDDTSDVDDGTGNSDISDILKDVLDSYFGTDTGEEEDTGESDGTETVEGGGTQTGEDGAQEGAEDVETDTLEDETDAPETLLFDTEVLNEIRDILREHADSTDSFMSGLTVSGNVIEVSLDSGSSALITDISDRQTETMDRLDGMSGLIFLIFFVLVFDLLHRFAKRIIKNFTGGDRNGTNS